MSISSQTARSQFTLASKPQTLTIPWYFLASTDLKVIRTSSGVDTEATLNTHYTVAGAGNEAGGTVTVLNAAFWTVGDTVTVYRAAPFTQPTEYTTNGQFPSATAETSADRITMLLQQIKLDAERSIRLPITESALDALVLGDRSSKVIGFDSNGALTYYGFVAGAVVPQSLTGTANQVLVNGGSGTPVTGAITLTLPQSIGTASTVRFARIGLNGVATDNHDIYVERSLPTTTAQASITVTGALSPAPATSLFANAFRDTTTFTATNAGDAYTCYDAQAVVGGSVALNHYYGYQCRNGFTGTGVLSILAGYATTNMGINSAGTISFMRGLYISQPTISGGGTVGQLDGIYMDALSNATGSVNAIYIAGANNVFMAGGQFGNSALLTYPAGAPTCRGYFTFNQTSQTGLAVMNSNATATGTLVSFCNNGGTVQGSITQTNSTTVAYNTSSDSRLKENVRNMSDSGALLDAIRPVLFRWKWGGSDIHGFLAQELAQVYPEAVTVGGDEVNDAGDLLHPWAVDFSKLVPVLVAEVKSLRARVAILEAA